MPPTAEDVAEQDGAAVFPLLADATNYRACEWDLIEADELRTYWVDLIATHFPTILHAGVDQEIEGGVSHDDAQAAATKGQAHFDAYLKRVRESMESFDRLDIITICEARQAALAVAGFADPFLSVKARENALALEVLPRLLEELDAADDRTRMTQIIEGVFAGNIFDLGATKTAALFEDGKSVDFHAVRAQLRPRPWLIDGLDAWLDRFDAQPAYEDAVVFVDNAGCDIVLGMIPFVRELLRRGTRVIMTANTKPALNDITHDELVPLVDTVAQFDDVIADALGDGSLELIASGNGLPLIDLTRVSPALCAAVASRPIDLIVLEGMGRSLESNFSTPFTVDTLKIAMLKDPGVAGSLEGEVYDLAMKYEQVG